MTSTDPGPAGLAVLELARTGRFADIVEMFAPSLRGMVSADGLRAVWSAEVGRHGPVSSVGAPVTEPAGPGVIAVKIPVAFDKGALTFVVSVTGSGLLAGIQLLPETAAEPTRPWQPPAYADPAAFAEQEVTVGTGRFAVPGTLSTPHRPGPLPGVVLLTGSGPNDRDETIGRNKPFKDLAWGLASQGVAVLRFDKVTYAHAADLAGISDFTVSDEYLPQAVAAVRLLSEHTQVDQGRIYVAGHSLGGTVAPRVAAAEPSVAGLIIMAGGAQPLHWSSVRQVRYLASLDPATAPGAQAAIDALTRQATMVDSPDLSPTTPATDLPFGVPAAYWLDLRGYDPAAAAAALGKPVLIVQGGRDYQATVADDLALWRAALDGRPGVTIRVYEADNHLFFPGSGPSSAVEYEPAQHMDPEVVADIAAWLTGRPSPG